MDSFGCSVGNRIFSFRVLIERIVDVALLLFAFSSEQVAALLFYYSIVPSRAGYPVYR